MLVRAMPLQDGQNTGANKQSKVLETDISYIGVNGCVLLDGVT